MPDGVMDPATPIHVVAAVIERDGKLLICRRPAHKRHGGLWEFPGGKLEAGETYLDAARRELAEELGIEVQSIGPALFSTGDPGSFFMIDFMPVAIAGEPRCLEHEALAWAAPADLAGWPLAPSDRQFALFLLGEGS